MFGKKNGEIQKLTPYLDTIATGVAHSSQINKIKILPDGTLASGADDNLIKIWNTATGLQKILNGHTNKVFTMEVLPSGLMISGSADKSLIVWNTTSGQQVQTILNAHAGNIYSIKTINECYFATAGSDSIVKVKNNFF